MDRTGAIHRLSLLAVVCVCLVGTGCAGDPDPDATDAAGTATATVLPPPPSPDGSVDAAGGYVDASAPGAGASVAGGNGDDDGPAGPSAATVALTTAPDGFFVVTRDSGESRALRFGEASTAEVQDALAAALGDAGTVGDAGDCGAGPRRAIEVGDLRVILDGDTVTGWTDGAGDPVLTTTSGVGTGSSLADVRRSYQVNVSEGSLGPEFVTADGTFGGILDGTADTARVTTLYAGETCFAR